MGTCSFDGCNGVVLAKALCRKHYLRNYRTGDPAGIKHNPVRRFWGYVEKGEGCWRWVGAKAGKYGRIAVHGRPTGAHRYSYELHHGPIPQGLVVMHTCDNPICVNPDHLKAGTYKENMADMDRKGRRVKASLKGEECRQSKLSDDLVRWIRAERSMTPTEIGRKLQMEPNTIRAVLQGKTWKHVT